MRSGSGSGCERQRSRERTLSAPLSGLGNPTARAAEVMRSQDGVWYGRVTTNDEVFEELMLDSAGFAHDTGRRVRKKDREEVQPVVKWIEKSKKWNDWADIEDDGEGDRRHQLLDSGDPLSHKQRTWAITRERSGRRGRPRQLPSQPSSDRVRVDAAALPW